MPTSDDAWRVASNGAGKRHWFLYRPVGRNGRREEYETKDGTRLVRFASLESAQRTADRLNNA